jgi:hypothetical protein
MSDVSGRSDLGRPPTPRWVKVFVIILLVLAALVILMLTGILGEGHGPGRHGGGHGATPPQNTSQITIS